MRGARADGGCGGGRPGGWIPPGNRRRAGQLARRARGGCCSEPGAGRERWLLVAVSLTAGQASLRMHVRRRLRSLGAAYLQSSVCLLPDQGRGAARGPPAAGPGAPRGRRRPLLRFALTEPGEADRVRAELNAARDAEYAEVLEGCPRCLPSAPRTG
jgi:hypothetical protein